MLESGAIGAARFAQQFCQGSYESPIEELLAWHLSKRLAPGVTLKSQVNIHTPLGRFRADLMLQSPGQVTILECDGKDFHEDEHRDHVRDIALLYATQASQVLRFTGEDLYGSLPDLLTVICTLHSDAFDERGRTFIRRCASPEANALSATQLRRFMYANVGGTLPGRRYRSAVLCRYALDNQHDPLLPPMLTALETGKFRSLVQAIDATRTVT